MQMVENMTTYVIIIFLSLFFLSMNIDGKPIYFQFFSYLLHNILSPLSSSFYSPFSLQLNVIKIPIVQKICAHFFLNQSVFLQDIFLFIWEAYVDVIEKRVHEIQQENSISCRFVIVLASSDLFFLLLLCLLYRPYICGK